MDPLRQTLTLFASQRPDPADGTFGYAAMQLWRGHAHIHTVQLLDYVTLPMPDEFNRDCLEQFATVTSRVCARLLDEEFFSRLQRGELHTLADYEKEFPAPGSGLR